MPSMSKSICVALSLSGLVGLVEPVAAQEFAPVEVAELKAAPQRFWAKGIVFRDTLEVLPGERTLKLDDGTVLTRFVTKNLGDVYVTSAALSGVTGLKAGEEYLFSGTVNQRDRKFFIFGGRKYLFVVKEVRPANISSSLIPQRLVELGTSGGDTPYNLVFKSLEGIMRDVEKDLFAYATVQGIEVKTIFDPAAGHMSKLKSSIHTALRRAENTTKTPSQELLVSVIASMMAVQSGYVEQAPEKYEPSGADAAGVQGEADAAAGEVIEVPAVSEEEWDLSKPSANADKAEPEVNTTNLNEVIEEISPQPSEEIAPGVEVTTPVEVEPASEPAAEPVTDPAE